MTGERNQAATIHSIVVDAFDVQTRLEETNPSIIYSGMWTAQDTIRAWSGTSLQTGGGTAARSATAGARVEFTFTGTSVRWIGRRGFATGLARIFLDGSLFDRYWGEPVGITRADWRRLASLSPRQHVHDQDAKENDQSELLRACGHHAGGCSL